MNCTYDQPDQGFGSPGAQSGQVETGGVYDDLLTHTRHWFQPPAGHRRVRAERPRNADRHGHRPGERSRAGRQGDGPPRGYWRPVRDGDDAYRQLHTGLAADWVVRPDG